MGRRRGKHRRQAASSASAPGAPGSTSSQAVARPELVGWREHLGALLESLGAWVREHAADAVQAQERTVFGDAALAEADAGPADAARAQALRRDRECVLLNLAVAAGPGPSGESLAERFGREAALPAEELEQIRRWTCERRRGVFLLQRADRDRLHVWDPLEGAPLSLHLLERLSLTQLGTLARGSVLTTSYQPWMARLVAVGLVEFYSEAKAQRLFREQVVESGRRWHEAPPPAPVRGD